MFISFNHIVLYLKIKTNYWSSCANTIVYILKKERIRSNKQVLFIMYVGLTWQAWARLMPTLKRADMPGGSEVGSVLPRPGSITRIHLTTASTISSLLNCLTLSISSLSCLWIINKITINYTDFISDTQSVCLKWTTHAFDHMMGWHSLILQGRTYGPFETVKLSTFYDFSTFLLVFFLFCFF